MADLNEVVGQKEQDEKPVAVPIYQRNGKPYTAKDGSPSTISVIGSESRTYRKALDAYHKEAAESGTEIPDDEVVVGKVALAVTGWHGWEANGEPLPCTPANVRALLSVGHILVQVQNGVMRSTDFFGAGSPA